MSGNAITPKIYWVLIVFTMKKNEVFYLDPLGKAPDTGLERLLNMYITLLSEICFYSYCFESEIVHQISRNGMLMFTTTVGQRQKWAYSTMVKYVKAPLQPGGTECGYCVMRFMKELMLDSTLMTNNFYGKHMYSQEELDDIRVECGLHFSKILA